jgi:hypothetical protein
MNSTTRKVLAGLAIGTATLGLSAGMASAGEITGNGKPTPIKSRQTVENPAGAANSACAFSGYNDGYIAGTEPSRTQSFGTDGPSQIGGQDLKELATTGFLRVVGPGTNCRGGYFPEE